MVDEDGEQHDDYIVSTMLLSSVAEKCGWQDYQSSFAASTASTSTKLEYQHPFCNRTGKLFAGDAFVDNDTGTGFVHIAPGHGLEDYQLGHANKACRSIRRWTTTAALRTPTICRLNSRCPPK